MNSKQLRLKKVGNHWLPCISHEIGDNIALNKKMDRYLDCLDFSKMEEIVIEFEELDIIWEGLNIVYFSEEDITRYLTTDDDFNIRFTINNHNFEISSSLYWLLEDQFNFNFHKVGYKIHIL